MPPLLSGEDQFSPSLFISDFRTAMSAVAIPIDGNVKKLHRPILDEYADLSDRIATLQIHEALTAEPLLAHPDFEPVTVEYRQRHHMLTRRFGLATLRLADRVDDSFAQVMEVPAKRLGVVEELGRDIKRVALYLRNKDPLSIQKHDLVDSFLVYNNAEVAKEITQSVAYTALGLGFVRRALHGHPIDPRRYLSSTIESVEQLVQDPRYAELGSSAVTQAVIYRTANPEAFLDSLVSAYEDVINDPEFRDFGPGILRDVVIYHRNPQLFLESAKRTIAELANEETYASLWPSSLMVVAVRHPEDPRRFLNQVMQKARELAALPEYSFLGYNSIVHAVIECPSSPEDYIEGKYR